MPSSSWSRHSELRARSGPFTPRAGTRLLAVAVALAVLVPTAAVAAASPAPTTDPAAQTASAPGAADALIHGAVHDAMGRPAAGITIVASAPGAGATAVTGADGAFVLEQLSADVEYVLYVTGQPGVHMAQYVALVDGVWTTREGAANATPVRGGSPALDLRLRPSPRIDGVLRDAAGAGIDGLSVKLRTSGTGEFAGVVWNTVGGAFAFDELTPGAGYILEVDRWGSPLYVGGYARVAADGSVALVDSLEEASVISTGTLGLEVTVGETAGFSGRLTGIGAGDEYTSFTLHTGDGTVVGWPGLVTAGWGLGEDGSYSLRSTVPGTYRIGVNRQSGISRYAATYFSATSPQGASTVAKASPLLLTAGEITSDVDVELRECASVSGKLTGWLPSHGMVTVYDDANLDVATRQAIVQPDGTYSVTGLLPGRYHVAVDYFADSEFAPSGKVFLGGGATEPERTRLNVPRCAPVKGVNIKVPTPDLAASEAPVVTGSAVVGGELTATPGDWTLAGAHAPSAPTTVRYQWLRDGKAIKGAKSATYVPARADVGKSLSVKVTAELTGFRKGTAESVGTAPVVAAP
ncbi:hypothetical protein [Oerskovia turbata]